jgi:hypothetical protein
MNKQTHEMLSRLERAGIKRDDAYALRRIAMTLHRWHELECGDGYGYIERDEDTGIPWYYNARASYLDPHDPRAGRIIPDREKGAYKRLDKIMANYPNFVSYVQGDPRGAPLYIVPKASLREGEQLDCCYSSRGIAIYK